VSAWPLALALVVIVLFKLAVSDGGRHAPTRAFAEVLVLGLLGMGVARGTLRPTAITRPLLVMLAAAMVTAIGSVNLEDSIREIQLWLLYLGIALVTASTVNESAMARRFLDALALIAGWLCLIALVMFWGAGNVSMRWYATFYWPNPFAAFLLLVVPPTFVRFLYASKGRDVLTHGLAVVLLLVALVFTYSRGAWITLSAVAAVALIVLRPLRRWNAVGRTAALGVLTALAVFTLVRAVGSPDIRQGIAARAVSVANPSDYSIQGRLSLWHAGLGIFLDHPLLGTGPGTFAVMHPAYQRDVRYYARDAHNLYIQTLAEMGAVGLIALLLVLVSVGLMWRRSLQAAQGKDAFPLIAGVGLGLLAFFLHSALDMDWMFPANPSAAFALIGLLASSDASYRAQLSARWVGPRAVEAVRAASRWATSALGLRVLALGAVLLALAATWILWVAEHHFVLAQDAARRGDWSLAVEDYAIAVRWDPLNSRYWDARASALVQTHEPRYAAAADALRRAMAVDRMNAALPFHLAVILISADAGPATQREVESLLRRSLELDRFNRPEAYRVLACLYRGQGQSDKAWEAYRQAMDLYTSRSLGQGSPLYLLLWPEVTVLFHDAAEWAVAQGDLDQAAQILERVLAEDPAAVGTVLRLSDLYVKMHRPDDARALLDATVRRVPNNPDLMKALNALR
jgi:O-antigen ligase/Tfp pilus assembly protein PilF